MPASGSSEEKGKAIMGETAGEAKREGGSDGDKGDAQEA